MAKKKEADLLTYLSSYSILNLFTECIMEWYNISYWFFVLKMEQQIFVPGLFTKETKSPS
jgi:hypothetical protein